ncbi:MAG: methyltransferase domain-containing protein [Chloroflexi bacterium]|nr:methyltransferase domain-containing protein [Chloroflexota bacterium]
MTDKPHDFEAYYDQLAAQFDQAAKLYDATYGPPTESGSGSPLLGWLRAEHLAVLQEVFPARGVLLDIGCGTGEEALHMAGAGYSVLGIDVSPAMVRQAQTKAAVHGIQLGLTFRELPAGKLADLDERGPFQGAYASLGTLNTEPQLDVVAAQLHELLEPGAAFVATVMSTRCLYERLRATRAQRLDRSPDWHDDRAGASGVVTTQRCYSPDDFAAAFAPHFAPERVWAFPLWLPPVHLGDIYRERQDRCGFWEQRDRQMREWPWFRARGDHFTMILRNTG